MTRPIIFGSLILACGGLCGADQSVVQGLNRFASSSYQQVAARGGNIVMSPFSISSALSMALVGARGQTAAEIAKVLGQANADPAYHRELAALVEQIAKAANSGPNQFLNADGLWVQKNFKILPDFLETLRTVYHAPPAEVDFAGDLEGARNAINQWTDRNTRSKIRELFARGSLDRQTRLVLGSAVYFYGKWERTFRKTDTHPEPFTLASGATEQTDFMHQTGGFGYAETAGGQILEMRYAGTGLAFDIMLPKKGAPVDGLDDRLAGWLGSLQEQPVRVSIPKFKIESEFSLASALSSMGMPSAFTSAADFSGIDDRRDLQLARVVHKAYVDVAEEGTEAAAATGAAVALVSMRMPKEVEFKADHPFLFAIRDTRSGLILFTGRLANPKRAG
jgi:serpin B